MDCLAINDADCSGSDQSFQLAQDVAPLAYKAGVNFAAYDYAVFVHSGNGQESSGNRNDVWSVTYLGGVYVNPCPNETCNQSTLTKFNIVPETEARGAVPLGVYCHEFGHQLGLPDMYDTKTGKSRMGGWELMDKGLWNGKPMGSEPAEMSSWSRNRLGWLPTENVATLSEGSTGMMNIAPLELSPSPGSVSAVVVAIATNEYYLFENREPIGNDAYLPDHGVVGYHINENGNYFSTMESPADESAFHIGDLVSSGQIKAKILAAYSNSSALVGFGSASTVTITQVSSLTIRVVPSDPINVTVDNQTYTVDPLTNSVAIVTHYPNETFNVRVPQTVGVQPGVRDRFYSWDDGVSNSSRYVTVNSNVTITVTYKRQYLVSVFSDYGKPSGSGWYDENSTATVSVDPTVDGPLGTRYLFAGWIGSVSNIANPSSVQVTQPVNFTAIWSTYYWTQLEFCDANSTSLVPNIVESLTIRAPNGSVLTIPNPQTTTSFWFEKGTYGVLNAYVLGVDTVSPNENFASSPNGVALIRLELYTLTLKVTDTIFGSPLNGGTATISLPNGQLRSAPIEDGNAAFTDLPAAAYSFNISRDWTIAVSGETGLPNQAFIGIGMVVISSVLIVALIILGCMISTLILITRYRASRRNRLRHRTRYEESYSDYWRRQG
jgi:M6 family metalloprotease-like protein